MIGSCSSARSLTSAKDSQHEVELLGRLNGLVTEEGATKGRPRIESDIDASEVILSLAVVAPSLLHQLVTAALS